jgi:hypothetical protein
VNRTRERRKRKQEVGRGTRFVCLTIGTHHLSALHRVNPLPPQLMQLRNESSNHSNHSGDASRVVDGRTNQSNSGVHSTTVGNSSEAVGDVDSDTSATLAAQKETREWVKHFKPNARSRQANNAAKRRATHHMLAMTTISPPVTDPLLTDPPVTGPPLTGPPLHLLTSSDISNMTLHARTPEPPHMPTPRMHPPPCESVECRTKKEDMLRHWMARHQGQSGHTNAPTAAVTSGPTNVPTAAATNGPTVAPTKIDVLAQLSMMSGVWASSSGGDSAGRKGVGDGDDSYYHATTTRVTQAMHPTHRAVGHASQNGAVSIGAATATAAATTTPTTTMTTMTTTNGLHSKKPCPFVRFEIAGQDESLGGEPIKASEKGMDNLLRCLTRSVYELDDIFGGVHPVYSQSTNFRSRTGEEGPSVAGVVCSVRGPSV